VVEVEVCSNSFATGDSTMNLLRHYPILSSLLSPFRRSQQKTCAALVAALCQAVQAPGFAIAGQLRRRFCNCVRQRSISAVAIRVASVAHRRARGVEISETKPVLGVHVDVIFIGVSYTH
jgi:hypothetical protein